MVKKSMKTLFVGLAALSASISASGDTLTQSNGFFQPRAFSANLVREMLMQGSKFKESDGWYGEFSATGAYQRNWSQGMETTADVDLADSVNGLGVFPFWSGTNVMSVNSADGSAAFDVDGYQFGLGQVKTVGSVTLDPIVYQAGSDFMFIVGSSNAEPGFFAKIKAPVGVYNMNPQLTETVATADAYPAGALELSDTYTYQPATTMTQAFAGYEPSGQTAQGDFATMKNGIIKGQNSTGAKFGDIELTAGYKFISSEDNAFSVGVRASAPTGGKATGEYLLEPIFGRGGNWGLGGYLDGHVKVWEGDNNNCFKIKMMANAMHLFNADTVRQYDLTANGGGSKYLLVADYSDNAYQGKIANLVNYSTLASTSSFGVEGDGVVSLCYMSGGWSADLGYEFWGRSAETLAITGTFAEQAYAVLGNQGVGQVGGTPATASNACQPLAQMNLASTDASATTVTAVGPASAQGDVVAATTAANRIGVADLNVAGAQQTASMTSKVFSKVAYEWVESDYSPHLGLLGEFEISNSNNNALPQWGVSLVGGVSF